MNRSEQIASTSKSKSDKKVVKMREPLLGIAVGKKGVGKTYATLKMVQGYLKGNPAKKIKGRKVLILDVNNEYGEVKKDVHPDFIHIRALDMKNLSEWTYNGIIEPRRISVLKPNGGKMNIVELQEALGYILETFVNGLFIIEDMTKFISDNLPSDLIGTIATQRHVSVDIITHFQSIGKAATPKIWANANWIRYHKCEDTVLRHKTKFAGEIEHLSILEKMVYMKYDSGEVYFHAYLDKDDGKIKGAFTVSDFKAAIEQYLMDNPRIVSVEVDRKELRTGVKIHKSQAAAVDYMINKYVIDYYGNPK